MEVVHIGMACNMQLVDLRGVWIVGLGPEGTLFAEVLGSRAGLIVLSRAVKWLAPQAAEDQPVLGQRAEQSIQLTNSARDTSFCQHALILKLIPHPLFHNRELLPSNYGLKPWETPSLAKQA
jgi:hypothetical protein